MSQADNARAVVATWRRGDHEKMWAAPAIGLPPSTLTEHYAGELQWLSEMTDAAANRLQLLGYLPSHTSVRSLRDQASVWAQAANRSREWAAALLEAEKEVPACAPSSD